MSDSNEQDDSPIGALEIAVLLIAIVLQLILQNIVPPNYQGALFLFLLALSFIVIAYARYRLQALEPASSEQKTSSQLPTTQNIVNILGGKVDEIIQSQTSNTTTFQFNIEMDNIVSRIQSDLYLSDQGKEEITSKIQTIKENLNKPKLNKSKIKETTDWLREKAPKWILEAIIKIGISKFPDLIDFFNSLL